MKHQKGTGLDESLEDAESAWNAFGSELGNLIGQDLAQLARRSSGDATHTKPNAEVSTPTQLKRRRK